MARSSRPRRNAAPIVSSGSNDHTRARICDAGEYAAQARNAPDASTISTVSPGPASPCTRSIAPEKTHGCFRSSDFSRPRFNKTFECVGTDVLMPLGAVFYPAPRAPLRRRIRVSFTGSACQTPDGSTPQRRADRSSVMSLNKKKVIAQLNRILECELAGVVRYTHYSMMIFGYSRIPIVAWFQAEAT